ncbi:MAG: FAD:protein FMN transferase [Candidatus Omnitrophica bacterium]|nr:FAD:protein FMN transferase [Candidatus Omnitrophota bacterium]
MKHKGLFFFVIFPLLVTSSCFGQKLYKNNFLIAGTYLEIISPDKEAAGIVYDEFRRLENIFNAYDDSSQLSGLNRSHGLGFKAAPELIEVLEIAQDVYRESEGAFDASCGRLFDFWKDIINDNSKKSLPASETIQGLKQFCSIKDISVNSADSNVTINKEGMKIDLGGIAKGYMVDKAAKRLKEKGISSAVINAGGDLYCLGDNNHKKWRIGIRDPESAKNIIKEQDLFNQAIATSGDYEQFFELDSKRFSHIIDPRTGLPADKGIVSVSVIADKCAYADAYATAFYVMGIAKVRDFFTRKKPPLKAFIVETGRSDYQVFN